VRSALAGAHAEHRAPHAGISLAGLAAAVLMALAFASAPGGPGSPTTTESDGHAAQSKLPLSFVPNRGQTDDRVRYTAQAPGLGVFLTDEKAVMSFRKGERGAALEMRFMGANPDARIIPGSRREGQVSYLTGSRHRSGLPTYGAVTYRELWPGIDMVFHGRPGRLKYEFHVAPGADPERIRLAYAGANGLALSDAGHLLVATPLGTLRDARPVSYQAVDGRRVPVESRYEIQGTRYGFALGAHDSGQPLVIDPGLEYSTYLGGGGGAGIAVDADGSTYVTGNTAATDFPTTPGAFDTTEGGGVGRGDVFVTKLNPAGSALVYSTYLGGISEDYAGGIAVDASGNAYITGLASPSRDFPTTAGAFDTEGAGSYYPRFVSKLNSDGSALVYSTFLAGSYYNYGVGDIAVDTTGSAYVIGTTDGTADFPTTAGAFDTTFNGHPSYTDVFVTKLNPTGSALTYSTFLGGSTFDHGQDVTVDASGNAYVTGTTSSVDFPATAGAFDTTKAPNDGDYFVTKLNPTGSALVYSTYLGGGSSYDVSNAIAVDASGSAYVTGNTDSAAFPTTPGAFDTDEPNGPTVSKLNPTGSALVYSTYLDGTVHTWPRSEQGSAAADIAVDTSGSAYVTGVAGKDFPTTPGAFDTSLTGFSDAFVTKLSANGAALSYSTYLGGQREDSGTAITVDPSGRAYVTGSTHLSSDFPTTPGAFRTLPSASPSHEAFVSKLHLAPAGYPRPKVATPFEVSLVPAYIPCGPPYRTPNRTHGPPLAFDSCNPALTVSDEATLGTPDSNGKPAKGEGRLEFVTLNGSLATPADEADVRITIALKDIYDHTTLDDYTGELRARVELRITDKLNNPGDNATMTDNRLVPAIPCTPTADTTEGAGCNLVTTVDAVTPGTVTEGKRAVWELGRVQIDDGGADGDVDTFGDNTLFMVQGLFVP